MSVFNTSQLVKQLKSDGQDFEFYPTTETMLSHIINDLSENVYADRSFDLLDVGAGDCRLHQMLSDLLVKSENEQYSSWTDRPIYSYYGSCLVIEKAMAHIQNLSRLPKPHKVKLVGTEFLETDLSCIKAQVCFVNPPYSSYELWLTQIIANARTPLIYAVIPKRWADNTTIKTTLKLRDMTATVIHSDDFLTADRQARATVDIVRIVHKSIVASEDIFWTKKSFFLPRNDNNTLDPLGAFFKPHLESEATADYSYCQEVKDRQKRAEDLLQIFKQDKLPGLIDSYLNDCQCLQEDLKALSQITPRLFGLFNIDGSTIIDKLRHDLSALKTQYWNIFFDCYDPIIGRMTVKSREQLKQMLNEQTDLDFTYTNCQAVSILAIQRANQFIDEQIKDLFYRHADKDNLACYKSNQRVLDKCDYRYRNNKQEFYHHTKLEYRLIVNYYLGYNYMNEFFDPDAYKTDSARHIINDYVVIARTLGIDIPFYQVTVKNDNHWDFGKTLMVTNSSNNELLFDIKFYKKGTYHIRLNGDFCLRLNVAIGRLFGWLHTADDISEIDDTADKSLWDTLEHITPKTLAIEFHAPDDTHSCDDEDMAVTV